MSVDIEPRHTVGKPLRGYTSEWATSVAFALCVLFSHDPQTKTSATSIAYDLFLARKARTKADHYSVLFAQYPYTSTDVIHSVVEEEEEVSGRFPKVLVYDGYDKAKSPGTE